MGCVGILVRRMWHHSATSWGECCHRKRKRVSFRRLLVLATSLNRFSESNAPLRGRPYVNTHAECGGVIANAVIVRNHAIFDSPSRTQIEANYILSW